MSGGGLSMTSGTPPGRGGSRPGCCGSCCMFIARFCATSRPPGGSTRYRNTPWNPPSSALALTLTLTLTLRSVEVTVLAPLFHAWERRLASAATNRIVRPFEWGLDWIDLPPNGHVAPDERLDAYVR